MSHLACVASAKGKGEGEGGGDTRKKGREKRGNWGGEKRRELPSLFSSPVPPLLPSFFLVFSPPSPFALATQAKSHPSQSTQLPLSKTSPFKKIWLPLSLLKMVVISSTPTASTWHHFRSNITNCSFNFCFK